MTVVEEQVVEQGVVVQGVVRFPCDVNSVIRGCTCWLVSRE